MESLQMSVHVVLPMAMMMGMGVLLRITGITDEATMKKVDKISFRAFIPMLVIYNIYQTDFSQLRNPMFLLYGVGGLTVLFVLTLLLVPRLIKDAPVASSFGQGIVRSNYVIFGAAVAEAIYGPGNIGIVMLLGALTVPLSSVYSAIILEMGRNSKSSPKQLAKAIASNPLLQAVIVGLIINLMGIRFPGVVEEVIADMAGLATPISFLSIGVTLGFGATTRKGLLTLATALRLVILPLVFLTGAVLLGFRGAELCALMILFGAPTAVSSYPMAVAMGADGELAGQMVAVSTLFCLPTIFAWTWILNSLQLL